MTDNFECLIQGLMDDEYGMVGDFIPPRLVSTLRANLLSRLATGEMMQAGVGQDNSFQQNNEVRRDREERQGEDAEGDRAGDGGEGVGHGNLLVRQRWPVDEPPRWRKGGRSGAIVAKRWRGRDRR